MDVRVLERRHDGDSYARKILLALQTTGTRRAVRPRAHSTSSTAAPEVRDEILAGQTPLGRILIEHNVLRRIEPTAFLRIVPGPAMMEWFGLTTPTPTYGRLALIHCDEQAGRRAAGDRRAGVRTSDSPLAA